MGWSPVLGSVRFIGVFPPPYEGDRNCRRSESCPVVRSGGARTGSHGAPSRTRRLLACRSALPVPPKACVLQSPFQSSCKLLGLILRVSPRRLPVEAVGGLTFGEVAGSRITGSSNR